MFSPPQVCRPDCLLLDFRPLLSALVPRHPSTSSCSCSLSKSRSFNLRERDAFQKRLFWEKQTMNGNVIVLGWCHQHDQNVDQISQSISRFFANEESLQTTLISKIDIYIYTVTSNQLTMKTPGHFSSHGRFPWISYQPFIQNSHLQHDLVHSFRCLRPRYSQKVGRFWDVEHVWDVHFGILGV